MYKQENWTDPFVLYGLEYTVVRAAVNDALYGNDFNKLLEVVKVLFEYNIGIKIDLLHFFRP